MKQYPQLQEQASRVVDLAVEEFFWRKLHGESMVLDEYCECFPEYAPQLQLALEEALGYEECVEEALPGFVQDLVGHCEEAMQTPHVGGVYEGYKILEKLGDGSFAHVFLAEDQSLGGRKTVIKVGEGFADEANVMGKLSPHDHIMEVFSTHVDQREQNVICMPYCGRTTLRTITKLTYRFHRRYGRPPRSSQLLRRVGVHLPWWKRWGTHQETILQWGLQAARALDHSHQLGVCHRDLKPSNVLIADGGQVKLLDFNLSDTQALTPGLLPTHVGGTPPYMSPEQFLWYGFARCGDFENLTRLAPLDERSDIYSLGVVMYELLMGQTPSGPTIDDARPQPTMYEVRAAQRNGVPHEELRKQGVDAEVVELIEHCLAFRQGDRLPTAAAAVAAFEERLTWPARIHRRLSSPSLAAIVLVFMMIMAVSMRLLGFDTRFGARQYEQGLQEYRARRYEQALPCFDDAVNHVHTSRERADALFALAQTRIELGVQCKLASNELKASIGRTRSSTKRESLCKDADARDASAVEHLHQAILDFQVARDFYLSEERKQYSQEYIAYSYARFDKYHDALEEQNLNYGDISPAGWNNIAWCYRQLGDRGKSLQCFQQALDRDPTLWRTHINRAEILLEGGDGERAEAVEHLQRAIAHIEQSGDDPGGGFFQAAALYARAAEKDRSQRKQALQHLRNALGFGVIELHLSPNGAVARLIRNRPELRQELAKAPRMSTPSRLIDPSRYHSTTPH